MGGKPFEVATKQVAKPRIIDERDAVVRITNTTMCGSDLKIYHGVIGSRKMPWTVGHEGMDKVVETGSAVTSIKEGDRVVISAVQDSWTVYSIDHVPARLAKAKAIGAVPININRGGLSSEQILRLAMDGRVRLRRGGVRQREAEAG